MLIVALEKVGRIPDVDLLSGFCEWMVIGKQVLRKVTLKSNPSLAFTTFKMTTYPTEI